MTEKELLDLKKEAESAEKEEIKITTQIETILKRLDDDRGIKSLEEAKELLHTMKSDLGEMKSQYEDLEKELEGQFEWED